MNLNFFLLHNPPTTSFNFSTIPTLHMIEKTLLNLLVALIAYLIAPQHYSQLLKLSFLFDY